MLVAHVKSGHIRAVDAWRTCVHIAVQQMSPISQSLLTLLINTKMHVPQQLPERRLYLMLRQHARIRLITAALYV